MKTSLLHCAVVLSLLCGRLGLAEDAPGITVSGTGEVRAKPNRLEIDLAAAGSAELTSDALVKYRDATQRTIDAFKQLNMENLKIEQRGIGIESQGALQQQVQFIGGMMNNQPTKTQIGISGSIRLSLVDVDKLSQEELTEAISKLLDTAKDSGAAIDSSGTAMMLARIYGQQASSPVVTFVLDNIDELRQQAYRDAFSQAKQRAERLAELAGAKLGPVLSMEETLEIAASNSSTQQRVMAAVYGWGDLGDKKDTRVTSDRLEEIPVRVNLKARFAIEPNAADK